MRLASPFTDHAVFQRGRSIPVWGTAAPETDVTIEFAGKSVSGKTDANGNFHLLLPPFEPGGPYELKIAGDGTEIVLHDILIGVVWVGSGQSNMEWTLEKADPAQLQQFFQENDDPSQVRIFLSPGTGWKYSTPENVKGFSAAAAWFALTLRKRLNIPVGILVGAVGGTPIEAWMDEKQEPSDSIRFVPKASVPLTDEAVLEFTSQDISGWKSMNFPGVWISSGVEKHGAVWFRRTLELPQEWAGKELRFRAGGIDKMDITFFNGVEIGRTGKELSHNDWSTPRNYTIPGTLVRPGANELAIRAFSWVNDGGFVGQPDDYRIELASDPSQSVPLKGEWKLKAEETFDSVLNAREPGSLFSAFILPLIPYAIDGVIWYQGEDNARCRESALLYESQMKALIASWRYLWRQGDFQFIQSQIVDYGTPAVFDADAALAYLRESQRLAAASTRNSGMAVLLGTGKGECHALDKRSAGERLANIALKETYGKKEICASGPVLREVRIEQSTVTLVFDEADGMYFSHDAGSSFQIAGRDRKFAAAVPEICGNTVILTCPEVPEPYAVRYAWAMWPTGNLLFNSAGLPASPFRTDNW